MNLQDGYLEQVTLRHLQDVLATATSGYWRHRADVLEAARPRPGEFHGLATPDALNARWEALTADALECRRHAALFDHDGIDLELVAEVLGIELSNALDSSSCEQVAA